MANMKKILEYSKQPANSIISKDIKGDIHYIDSFGIEINNTNSYSIDYLVALVFSSIPGWTRVLLKLRDFLVKPFGLETGLVPEQKALDASLRYNIGDRATFFPVIDRSESEIVMSEDDKHLYFRISLLVEKNSHHNLDVIYLTTLVQFHNIWGKLYFAPVKPFHKMIMRSLLKKLSQTLN